MADHFVDAAQVPAPVPVAFSLTPALANSGGVIDYSTSEGIKLYAAATRSLYPKESVPFNCTAAALKDFIGLITDRSYSQGWSTILEIGLDPTDLINGDTINLLENYGNVTMATIRAHVEAYIGTNTRAAQDSRQLYECLMASITIEGRNKITIWRDQYTVNGQASGVLLLKVIIMKAEGFPIISHTPTIHCKVFEDNSGALEIASVHKARPRTKHINVRLHHFRDYVDRKEVSILPMRTEDMPADFLTKPVNKDILWKHRRTIMGAKTSSFWIITRAFWSREKEFPI